MQSITMLPLPFHMETAEQGKIVHRKVLLPAKSFQLSFFLGLSFLLEHRLLLHVGVYLDRLEHISFQSCAALRRSSKQAMRQESKE